MRLTSLTIEGFRGIRNRLELTFHPRLTVLVGINGGGKTSVLDALALLLDGYLARYIRASPQSASRLKDGDVNLVTGRTELTINVVVEENAGDEGQPLRWVIRRQDRHQSPVAQEASDFDALNAYVRRHAEEKGKDIAGDPLILYYGQRRVTFDFPERIRDTADLDPIAAFSKALEPSIDYREFVAWFRDQTYTVNAWTIEERLEETGDQGTEIRAKRTRQLNAVRSAISSATGFLRLFYQAETPRGLYVVKPGGIGGTSPPFNIPVSNLSSGEQIYLALIGDIARRMAMLNPGLENPLHGRGLILIDEIDLHLHPGWQRKILPLLTGTFPNCQFVVTTHSPQVLGEVAAESIRILRLEEDGSVCVTSPRASLGRDSNYLLLSVLDAEERDEGLKQQLDRLERAIGDGRTDEALHLLAELETAIEGDAPELVLAQARLERRLRRSREG